MHAKRGTCLHSHRLRLSRKCKAAAAISTSVGSLRIHQPSLATAFAPSITLLEINVATMPGFTTSMPGSKPPVDIESGTVRLFKDSNWTSASTDLRTDGNDTNTPGVDYNLIGTGWDNVVSWVAFNLPVGVVVTLCETAYYPRENVASLVGCGRTVDLVGTGNTEGVDLSSQNFDNLMSAWFWRNVDPDLGAIELFQYINYGGPRTVIFLSDWKPGTLNSMVGWYIDNACSSAKWNTLDDRIIFTLAAEPNGTLWRRTLAGYNKTREIPDLGVGYTANIMSSFQWSGLNPKREIIKAFQIPLEVDLDNSKTFTTSHTHVSETDLQQEFEMKVLERPDTETLTVSTTDSARGGFAMAVTSSNPGEGSHELDCSCASSFSTSLSMTISYDYTQTSPEKPTVAQTGPAVLTEMTFKAAPRRKTVGSVTARIALVPPTKFETTARRWYDRQLPGSDKDPNDQKGWYVRDETVKGSVEGWVRASTKSHDYHV